MKSSALHLAIGIAAGVLLFGPILPSASAQTYTNGNAYVIGPSDAPTGTATINGGVQVLEYAGAPVTISVTQNNVLATNGAPLNTYAADVAAGTTAIPGTGATNAGEYLVNSTTGALVTPANAPTGLNTANAAPTGYAWVQPSAVDPTTPFQWVPATYANDPTLSKAYVTTAGQGSAAGGQYVVNSNGALVPASALTALNGLTGSAFTAVLPVGDKLVSASAIDPTLASPTDYTFKGVTGATVSNGASTLTVTPGSVGVADSKGNQTTVTSTGIITTGAVQAATVSAGVLSTQDSHGTVYANVGDALTSQGAAIASNTAAIANEQTAINNLSAYTNKEVKLLSGGIAAATAFEAPQVDPGHKFGVSLNWGEFNSQSAFSGVGKFRFTDNWSATAGVGVSTNGYVAAKAGIQTQW